MEGKLVGVEVGAIEGIGGPQVWCLALRVKDLCIELTCCVYTTDKKYVSVPDLKSLGQKPHATLL